MMREKFYLQVLGIMLIVFVGLQCGAPALKQKSIVPIIPRDDKRFSPGEELNSVSITQDQLSITVKYLEPEDLKLFSIHVRQLSPMDFAPLFSGQYINYADEKYEEMLIAYNLYAEVGRVRLFNKLGESSLCGGWLESPYFDEEARPNFTAFMVTFNNNGEEKVGFDPALFVMVDDQGHQHSALSYQEALMKSMDFRGAFGFRPIYPPYAQPYYAHNLFGARYFIRSNILAQTLLKEKRVYPKAKVEGIVLFPRLQQEVKNFRLILPEVIFFKGNKEVERLDFEFEFWRGEVE